MSKTVNVLSVQRRLRREHRRLKSWRLVAAKYDVNVAHVFNLAEYGKEPANQEVRYRLGLDRRPVERAKRVPSAFRVIWDRMAAETRAALKGWRS